MSEHLNQLAIAKYKQSALSPTELLIVDDHLADCADCRRRIRQNQDSAALYESFFEPLNRFAASNEHANNNGSKAKSRLLKKLKGFHFEALSAVWQPQFALTLIVIVMFGGLLILWQEHEPPVNELAAKNERKEASVSEFSNNAAVTLEDEKVIKPNENASVEARSDKSGLAAAKPDKEQSLVSKIVKSPILNRPKINARTIKINQLEADESETLNAESDPAKSLGRSSTIQLAKRNNTFGIDFSPIEGADEYEIYLAEMPQFVTVSREKVKKAKWTIPSRKLKVGRSYVLQVTALKENQAIQLTKKIINVEAVPPN